MCVGEGVYIGNRWNGWKDLMMLIKIVSIVGVPTAIIRL